MIEFLFLVGFAVVLVVAGVNAASIIAAFVVGFALMAIAGMVGLMFKLLPWILLIIVIVWFAKNKSAKNYFNN